MATSAFFARYRWGLFPLSVSANGRYLQTVSGTPFFSIIDTAWCAPQQLTTSQMDTYVADCVTRKINGIIVELIESAFSDNAPNTIDSIAPFSTPNDFSTTNNTYFARVDYLVQKCLDAGIVVWMWPLYIGLQPGGSQGWSSQFDAESTADRQGWGTFVGNRYKNYKNIVFVHGGDGTPASFTNINHYIDTLITAAPGFLHSFHAERGVSAYSSANAQSWLNLNNTYISTGPGEAAVTEWGRSPVRPVFFVEGNYETAGSGGSGIRTELWQSLCSGCLAGVAYGHNDIWTFGGPGFDQNFASHYGDDGRASLQHMRTLIDLYSWWLLEPKTDTSLVTTALGSGASKICPMLASDASFAWIYSPSVNFTLQKAAFAPSLIRIRSYTTSSGAFSTITASTANTGTQAITVSADQVIVVDAA